MEAYLLSIGQVGLRFGVYVTGHLQTILPDTRIVSVATVEQAIAEPGLLEALGILMEPSIEGLEDLQKAIDRLAAEMVRLGRDPMRIMVFYHRDDVDTLMVPAMNLANRGGGTYFLYGEMGRAIGTLKEIRGHLNTCKPDVVAPASTESAK